MHHAVAVPFVGAGHIRPFLGFITYAVAKYPTLVFTVITHKHFVPLALSEVQRSDISASAAERVHVIGVYDGEILPGLHGILQRGQQFIDFFPKAYQAVVDQQEVVCTATGTVHNFKDIPQPKLFIDDILNAAAGDVAREITPGIKVLCHWIGTVHATLRSCLPKEQGGLASWEEDTNKLIAAHPDLTFDQVAHLVEVAGEPWKNPEGLSLYDYEHHPQEMPPIEIAKVVMQGIREMNEIADGVICSTTPSFEPNATKAGLNWWQDTKGKRLFHIGFHSIDTMIGHPSLTADTLAKHEDIFAFLDSHPPKSVWLISFGSQFYPALHPSHLHEGLLKTLRETNTPFILSRAGVAAAMCPVPADIEQMVAESNGLAMIVPSVPQQDVLLHPSTGVFLTHGGVNSMFETIVAGVLPVFWPFAADQPVIAAYLADKKDCAFELMQVRTGKHGLRPPLRGGSIEGSNDAVAAEVRRIISEVNGSTGARKRANFEVVRQEFLAAMKPGGEVDIEIAQLFRFCFGSNDF